MTRQEILNNASKQITGKRTTDYGKPEDNFLIISKLWSAYTGINISSIDVAMMMSLLKIARIKTGFGGTDDCFIDLAGYAACGGELASPAKSDDPSAEQNIPARNGLSGFVPAPPEYLHGSKGCGRSLH